MREWPDYEEHHLFPRQQGLRERFERREVFVDDWAILIPETKHREAHRRDGGDSGPGGKWNWDWAQWWKVQLRRGGEVSADAIFVRALQMIREHRLDRYGMPFQYGCGRAISRDLYDIVEPPRFIQ